MVRFFLDGRAGSVRPLALEGAVSALSGVPDDIRARTLLLAGNVSGAVDLANRSPTAGSFEWTRFLLDLARYELGHRDVRAAEDVLAKIAPAARRECGSLILERDAVRASGDSQGAAS